MKVKVSVIEYDSDIALMNREIEIPDNGYVNENVRNSILLEDYEIVRMHNTDEVCFVYVSNNRRRSIF